MFRLTDAAIVDAIANASFLYLAVPASGAGVVVVDVSDPASPVARGSYSRGAPGDAFVGLAVQGAIAYILVWAQGSDRQELHVLDVSDLASPRRVALLEMGDAAPHELLVRGGYAYVADADVEP